MTPPATRRILFVKRVLCDYQVPFFLALQPRLAADGIALAIAAGRPRPNEGLTDGLDQVPFATPTPLVPIGPLYWTRAIPPGRADLLLLEQASAQLVNYPRLAIRAFGGGPITALVGHGAHFNRAGRAPFRDAWRRFWLRRADWFFAYTPRAARAVEQAGFPADRITVFENTVDTRAWQVALDAVSEPERQRLRFALFQETEPRPTGLFCGRLVAEKEIPFLLHSLTLLHRRLPDFRMILIGDGPERDAVKSFCAETNWCRWVGRHTGADRAPYFRLASLFLHPAPIGLALLDAFAAALPVATTRSDRHGPEIDYLTPGVNGLATEPDPIAFATASAALLADAAACVAFGQAARREAQTHSVERMADLFADGIRRALNRSRTP